MENRIISYLTFKIGLETFAVNVENIQNIIEFPTLTKVPEMPSFIIGGTDLRGVVLPVVDSRIKFGITETPITPKTCIIVLEMAIEDIETKVGLLVDEVSEVLEIVNEDIKEPPSVGSKFKSDIITGVFPLENRFIMLLDIRKVVASEELLNIREL
ncbi:MAG: purine-binding chemotaxis protein CheW [Chloroflexia bacterium]|nr:purine-binding chemotaxis protein CheW [Chloroflexia bacterium]